MKNRYSPPILFLPKNHKSVYNNSKRFPFNEVKGENMNTIKIYLAESGRIADLRKDFPLYQGQFQSKLLNVYVPTSIVAPEFTSSDSNGNTLKDYVASTSVKIGMTYTARNGTLKTSKNYYMRYLKTLTQNGVEYALYERKLPKEFTLYAGAGTNAPVLVANVVNILQDTETGEPEILSITTTQTCSLDVMPSTDLDNDEAIEPTELENLNAEINAINDTLIKKQDKEDFRLETINKTVVGAINENKNNIEINTATAQANAETVADLKNQVDELSNRAWQQENYVGQMSGSSLPSNLLLNNFVENTLGRAPQNADVVIFVLRNGDANRTYKYTYYDNGWGGYQLTVISRANNTTYGTIRGTFGTDDDNEVLLDISDGEVQHIWIKDAAENYRDLHEYLATTNQSIVDIINGQTTVGTALKAVEDQLGRNIFDTYLTKIDGATKNFVRDYAMPREFSTVYFISTNGYVTKVPTTPESGIQFTAMVDNVGTYELFNLSRTLDADFELTTSNGYQNNIFVSASADCNVQFKMTTRYKKVGEDWANLSVELTSPYSLTTDDVQKIVFSSPFIALGDNIVQLQSGDLISQTLEIVSQTVGDVAFDIYSNEIYPSIFTLTSQSYISRDIQSVIGKTLVLGMDGTVEENNVIFVVQNSNDFVEYLTNQRQFLGILSLPLVGELDDNLSVKIEFGDTVYNLYSYEKGASAPLTIGDLRSVMDYNTNIGYSFFPELYFIDTTDIKGFALVPSTITADQLINILGENGSVIPSLNGKKIDFNLSAELTNRIMKTLITPMSAPASTELVGINPNREQTNIGIGFGLQIADGVLRTSGEATGTVVSVNGETVPEWNADTKADLTNNEQVITAGRLVIDQIERGIGAELANKAGIYLHGEQPSIVLRSDNAPDNIISTGVISARFNVDNNESSLNISGRDKLRLYGGYGIEIDAMDDLVTFTSPILLKNQELYFQRTSGGSDPVELGRANISFRADSGINISSDAKINGDLAVSGAITGNETLNIGGILVNDTPIFDIVYPIGAIYISANNDVSPASLFGGTWEKIPEKYALWTTNETITNEGEADAWNGVGVRRLKNAIPNITGYVNNALGDQALNNSGGCYQTFAGSIGFQGGSAHKWTGLGFNAYHGDDSPYKVYRSEIDYVQPPAYKVHAWKRVS